MKRRANARDNFELLLKDNKAINTENAPVLHEALHALIEIAKESDDEVNLLFETSSALRASGNERRAKFLRNFYNCERDKVPSIIHMMAQDDQAELLHSLKLLLDKSIDVEL